MGDDGIDSGLLTISLKSSDFVPSIGSRFPLTRRLGKNLDALAPERLAANERFAHSAGD